MLFVVEYQRFDPLYDSREGSMAERKPRKTPEEVAEHLNSILANLRRLADEDTNIVREVTSAAWDKAQTLKDLGLIRRIDSSTFPRVTWWVNPDYVVTADDIIKLRFFKKLDLPLDRIDDPIIGRLVLTIAAEREEARSAAKTAREGLQRQTRLHTQEARQLRSELSALRKELATVRASVAEEILAELREHLAR